MVKKVLAAFPGRTKLAYENGDFLTSVDARTIRILSEYLEPQSQLRRAGVRHTVVFFGSARIISREQAVEKLRELKDTRRVTAARPAELKAARMAIDMSRYYEEAQELAALITRWSLRLNRGNGFLNVCSGGGPGIMEAANRGAASAGGRSLGLNIVLPTEQSPNAYITPELSFLFHYFFMRKLWFAQPAKALVVFPGGFGTMDELWEFLTLVQSGKMDKRTTILLYGSDFWKRAVNFEWLRKAGTISDEDLSLIHYADSPKEAFSVLKKKLQGDRSLRFAFPRRFF